MSIPDNLLAVERRIVGACNRAGRRREEVTLVAVSKTFPPSYVDEAIAAGVTDLGENRVQEAREKKSRVTGSARWHLIGHLQSNKAKDAVLLFDMIQTIDTVALADRVARAAASAGKTQEALLEVNIASEPQKSGAEPSGVSTLLRGASAHETLRVVGLMAIPPAGEREQTRRWFREMRALRDDCGLEHLSMGMTDDFEVAIEEGATIIRVGRAIFGERG